MQMENTTYKNFTSALAATGRAIILLDLQELLDTLVGEGERARLLTLWAKASWRSYTYRVHSASARLWVVLTEDDQAEGTVSDSTAISSITLLNAMFNEYVAQPIGPSNVPEIVYNDEGGTELTSQIITKGAFKVPKTLRDYFSSREDKAETADQIKAYLVGTYISGDASSNAVNVTLSSDLRYSKQDFQASSKLGLLSKF